MCIIHTLCFSVESVSRLLLFGRFFTSNLLCNFPLNPLYRGTGKISNFSLRNSMTPAFVLRGFPSWWDHSVTQPRCCRPRWAFDMKILMDEQFRWTDLISDSRTRCFHRHCKATFVCVLSNTSATTSVESISHILRNASVAELWPIPFALSETFPASSGFFVSEHIRPSEQGPLRSLYPVHTVHLHHWQASLFPAAHLDF